MLQSIIPVEIEPVSVVGEGLVSRNPEPKVSLEGEGLVTGELEPRVSLVGEGPVTDKLEPKESLVVPELGPKDRAMVVVGVGVKDSGHKALLLDTGRSVELGQA